MRFRMCCGPSMFCQHGLRRILLVLLCYVWHCWVGLGCCVLLCYVMSCVIPRTVSRSIDINSNLSWHLSSAKNHIGQREIDRDEEKEIMRLVDLLRWCGMLKVVVSLEMYRLPNLYANISKTQRILRKRSSCLYIYIKNILLFWFDLVLAELGSNRQLIFGRYICIHTN